MPKEFSTPGPRAIYPDVCDSRSLGACGLLANVIWPRLIAIADDQGRIAGDATDVLTVALANIRRKVKHREVEIALEELARAKQILVYTVDGEPYIQIVSWWTWQHSQRRAYHSRHPAPKGWTDYVYGYPGAEHATFRAAGGFPQRTRTLPSPTPDGADKPGRPEPQDDDPGTATDPGRADKEGATEPHAADTSDDLGIDPEDGLHPESGSDRPVARFGRRSENGRSPSAPRTPKTRSQARVAVPERGSQPQVAVPSLAQPRVPRTRALPGPARPMPEKVPFTESERGGGKDAVGNPSANGTDGGRLTADQLAQWSSFDDPCWAPFRIAWLERGFRLPPFGSATDGDESQRGMLWQIVRDWPRAAGDWVREVPRGTPARDVIGHVIERFHERRAEAGVEDPEWAQAKEDERAQAGRAMAGIGAVLGSIAAGDGEDLDFGAGA